MMVLKCIKNKNRRKQIFELKDCLAKMNNKGGERTVLESEAARLLDLRTGKEQLVVNAGN